MKEKKTKDGQKKSRRYLMEIRGVLHVDAPDGDTAREAVQAWIDAASAFMATQTGNDAEANVTSSVKEDSAVEPVVRVGWLRSYPED